MRPKESCSTSTTEDPDSQADPRFGRNGRLAWIYWIWPFGPLPAAGLFIWTVMQADQPFHYITILAITVVGFVFMAWLCSMGIIMDLEGFRTVQRASIAGERVHLRLYFGRSRTVDRNAPLEIAPHTVSTGRMWASMATTFMSVRQTNWRVFINGETSLLMNGQQFDPYKLFPNAKNIEESSAIHSDP